MPGSYLHTVSSPLVQERPWRVYSGAHHQCLSDGVKTAVLKTRSSHLAVDWLPVQPSSDHPLGIRLETFEYDSAFGGGQHSVRAGPDYPTLVPALVIAPFQCLPERFEQDVMANDVGMKDHLVPIIGL